MKNYREFLKGSLVKEPIISILLDNLDGMIQKQVGNYAIEYNKTFGKLPSEYEQEVKKLTLVYDLVKSIEKYTKSGDTLITFNVVVSNKGNFEFTGKIKRQDVIYDLQTEVIYAGGHNIQALHYRYLTKTNLPKTDETTVTKELKVKIDSLTKNEKFLKEIANIEDKIKEIENARSSESYSEEEVSDIIRKQDRNRGYFEDETLSWKEIVKRGAHVNFKDEQDFLRKREEDRKQTITSWLRINTMSIKQKELSIKDYNKQIVKLKSKIIY